MPILNKDDILNATDFKVEPVEVPEWGKDAIVYVRTISAKDKDSLDNSLFDFNSKTGEVSRNAENIRIKWCIACICDADGNSLFTAEDLEALGAKAAAPITRCWMKATKLNGDQPNEIEEQEKNL